MPKSTTISQEAWQAYIIERGPVEAGYKRVDLTKAYPNEEVETRKNWSSAKSTLSVRADRLKFGNDANLMRASGPIEANRSNMSSLKTSNAREISRS